MRYLSVCSGIEAATVAWHPLGWTPVGLSEIEPFPRAVLQHRLGAVPVDWEHAWSPQTNILPLFGDFTKIQPEHVGPVDLLVGGTPCFPAGTTVATNRGLLPIEQVVVGDMALTHEGRWRRVLRTGSKMAETVVVTGQGHHGLVTTANHPFLARTKRSSSTREGGIAVRKAWIEGPDWIAAEDMTGRHWGCVSRWPWSAVPPVESIGREKPIQIPDTALLALAGAYLGDGWVRINDRRGFVLFGLNAAKLEALRPIFDACGAYSVGETRTGYRVQLSSRPLARWLAKNFGTGADGKSVPMWALGTPERARIVEGYRLTDGGSYTDGFKATTISRALALSMRMLAVSCGYASSVTKAARPVDAWIEGRLVRQHDTYVVTFSRSARSSFEEDGARWQRVRRVETTGRTKLVYDLEVEEDHSYVADGILVHNCQSFSVAGKRLGLDDPRGNLAVEFLALARRIRARWIVWENVPGVLSSWSGEAPDAPDMEAEPGRSDWSADYDETGDFHAFLELFRECGYRGAYRVLDAQYIRVDGYERAVPQRRRRVFVVGHSGNDNRALPVLFDAYSLRGDSAPRRSKGQRATRDIAPCITGGGVGFSRTGDTRGQDPVIAERLAFGGNNTVGPIDVATAVRAHAGPQFDFESETFIGEAITFPAFMSGTAEVAHHPTSNALQATNPTAVAFTAKDSGQDASEDVSPTLRSMGHAESHPNGGGQVAVAAPFAFKASHFTRGKDGAPSPTAFALSADADMGDQDNLVAAPLTAGMSKSSARMPHEQGTLIPEPVAFDETQMTHPANHSVPKPGDPCHPLAAGARPPAIAFAFQTRIARNDRGQPEEICPTLNGADAGETSDSRPAVAFTVSQNSNGFAWEGDIAPAVQAHQPNPEANTFSGVAEHWAVRRLTPRECERLQGFPDDWTLIPYGSRTAIDGETLAYLQATYPDMTLEQAQSLAADAPRYKAVGNSKAINAVRWIGQRIDMIERALG